MSSYSQFIVTGQQVREVSGTSQNVEDRKIQPIIRIAQQGSEQVLGRTLYALVESAYVADAGVIAGGNPTTMGGSGMLLLYSEYLLPSIVFRVMADAGIDLAIDYDRNGEFERNGNDYNTVSDRRMAAKTGKAEARADRYQQRLLDYVRGLEDTDPIKIAFKENEPCEERVKKTYQSNIILRISERQFTHNQ